MIREIGALLFFTLATIFGCVGLWGLFRFDESLDKMQGGALCGTTSVFSVFIGLLLLAPTPQLFIRLIVIMLLFVISSPTSTYIVSRLIWQTNMGGDND